LRGIKPERNLISSSYQTQTHSDSILKTKKVSSSTNFALFTPQNSLLQTTKKYIFDFEYISSQNCTFKIKFNSKMVSQRGLVLCLAVVFVAVLAIEAAAPQCRKNEQCRGLLRRELCKCPTQQKCSRVRLFEFRCQNRTEDSDSSSSEEVTTTTTTTTEAPTTTEEPTTTEVPTTTEEITTTTEVPVTTEEPITTEEPTTAAP